MAYDDFAVEEEPLREDAMGKSRYIEDDLKVLSGIEGQIMDLLRARNERLQNIKDSHFNYKERIQASEDWFEGFVKGNPVPDRGPEVSKRAHF